MLYIVQLQVIYNYYLRGKSKQIQEPMSLTKNVENDIVAQSSKQTGKWSRYEAAQAQFGNLRQKLIKQIMVMDVKPEQSFFDKLHEKINQIKHCQAFQKIVRSVVTGESLQEIHHKYVSQNVHQGSQTTQIIGLTPQAQRIPQSTIEGQIQAQQKILSKDGVTAQQKLSEQKAQDIGIVDASQLNDASQNRNMNEIIPQISQNRQDPQIENNVLFSENIQEGEIKIPQTQNSTPSTQNATNQTVTQTKNVQVDTPLRQQQNRQNNPIVQSPQNVQNTTQNQQKDNTQIISTPEMTKQDNGNENVPKQSQKKQETSQNKQPNDIKKQEVKQEQKQEVKQEKKEQVKQEKKQQVKQGKAEEKRQQPQQVKEEKIEPKVQQQVKNENDKKEQVKNNTNNKNTNNNKKKKKR